MCLLFRTGRRWSNRFTSKRVTHGRISLLGLTSLLGEDDQSTPVLLQPLHINLFTLLTPRFPPVINHDSQTLRLLSRDSSLFDLAQSETTTDSSLGVVSNGRASDGRTEELKRSNTESECFLFTGSPSSVFTSGLVEPGLDSALQERRSNAGRLVSCASTALHVDSK